jgi:hypothetical protein
VRSVSAREADRLDRDGVLSATAEPVLDPDTGLPTGHVKQERIPVQRTAPEIKMVQWVDKRNGVTKMVPEGIDPGFEFRPGEARKKALDG